MTDDAEAVYRAALERIEARLSAVTITGGASVELADAIEQSRDIARAVLSPTHDEKGNALTDASERGS